MMQVRTFVFFDSETTGLIQEKVMPRITEIALVAVLRESICNSNRNSLPRVLHKLVLPVNPQKIITPHVEHITKLYNDEMQLLQPFDSGLHELIIGFLRRLVPPICFVAHNGNRFDYPIFLGELERINKVFNSEILCIDTWKMFQDYFKKKEAEPKAIQDLLNDEYNDSLSTLDMDMDMEEEAKVVATTSTAQTMLPCDGQYINVINNKKRDANGKYCNDVDIRLSKNPIQEANEKTPKNQIIRMENIFAQRPFKRSNPKKRLNFECKKPINLKLIAIYEYMFGTNFSQNHSAEADCLAMLRCVINIADFFLDWSDNHAIPFVCCNKT